MIITFKNLNRNTMKMNRIKVAVILSFVLLCIDSYGQLFRSTIRPGSGGNKVDIFVTPDFSSTNEHYLLQFQFAVAFPASALPAPTDYNVTLHPDFVATFGNNYVLLKHTLSSNSLGNENFFAVTLSRTGAGASAFQTWVSGTEYPVLTFSFVNANAGPTPSAIVKLVDYEDQGGNGNGNTYVVNELNDYYYDFDNSQNNFYGAAGLTNPDPVDNLLNGWVQTNSVITLPVSYLNFSGYKNGTKNTLKWTTGSEQNNVGFDVQRSVDGINFTSLGFVNSLATNGNSTSALAYSFDDNAPSAAKRNYYRLVQKDFDGRGKQSNVVVVSGDKPTTIGITGLFPNPASNQVNVLVAAPARQDVTLVIMDVMGKTVKQSQVNVETGSNTIPLEIGNLAAGSYLVKVVCKADCESAVTKFIKQ